jgi:hypothetical protein
VPRLKDVPKGKRVLFVYISEDLYKQLIEIAPVQYGKHHGALSYVVEEALRHYLLPRQHTNSTQNPRLGVRHVYEQVVEKVKEILHYNFKPTEIPEKILDQAIAEVRGSDPRTVKKWKNILQKSGLIKFIGGFPPNRVVELM